MFDLVAVHPVSNGRASKSDHLTKSIFALAIVCGFCKRWRCSQYRICNTLNAMPFRMVIVVYVHTSGNHSTGQYVGVLSLHIVWIPLRQSQPVNLKYECCTMPSLISRPRQVVMHCICMCWKSAISIMDVFNGDILAAAESSCCLDMNAFQESRDTVFS